VAKRHIAYQQVFKIPSASASTRPHGLRKPAARYTKGGSFTSHRLRHRAKKNALVLNKKQ